ncbi:MAG: hypothetical protein H7226_04655 [Salinibacterium sp.]|nr:hypothetical protein [Salinibacterium sp.]
MDAFLSDIRVIGGPIPIVVVMLAVLAAAGLIIRRTPRGRPRRRWVVTVLIALVVGAAIGLLACWVIGDLMNTFDVQLSPTSRAWVAVACAGMALAIANLRSVRVRRRAGAAASIVLFALVGALGVNADFGQYTTVGSMLGTSAFAPLPAVDLALQRAGAGTDSASEHQLWKTWAAPAGIAAHGIVGSVTIPSSVSHFAARNALVYLPPAALVPHPPALPVLVMMSGQPGSPENVFLAGHLDKLMDAMAAEHHGLAPIVVVPDQLSAPTVNPMCVDSALGNSATYLTVDVPTWIRANLDVQSAATGWGIGGFSQGGTCAIQLGAGHPEIFGSIMDVSGELEPRVGTPEQTIARGFGGNSAAYEAAKPLAILTRESPYRDMVAIFAAGSLDSKYMPWIATVAAASQMVGMQTTVLTSPGTAHDWSTVRYAFEHGMPALYAQMGLSRPAS